MADKQIASNNTQPEVEDEGGGLKFYMMLFLGGFAGLIFLIFLFGVGLAVLADPGPTAQRISLLRDIFIIVMALQMIVIIVALAALVVQFAKLVNLLTNEVKPILDNAQEATDTARGTAQFVGSNVTGPIVQLKSFMAGLFVFLRELGGIRRAIRPSRKGRSGASADDGE